MDFPPAPAQNFAPNARLGEMRDVIRAYQGVCADVIKPQTFARLPVCIDQAHYSAAEVAIGGARPA